jgi:hypothetical protein
MNARSLWLSVLIAGALIALLGNLPFVNLVNCLLCIWVWVGGSIAVYFYRRFQGGAAPTPAQGAGLGALSGLAGAILGFFVFLVTGPLLTSIFRGLAQSLQVQGMPLEPSAGGNTAAAFVFLLVDAVLYPLFGALGGLVTASLMKERKAPA